jgi:hypothetical protein
VKPPAETRPIEANGTTVICGHADAQWGTPTKGADFCAFDPECTLATDVGLGLRPKNIGARVKRVEDPRLLTGQGSFTADRIVPGALHVAFRRSDHAHALIASISASAAAEVPGVFAIYTAQDLQDLVEPVRASSRMKNYYATALKRTATFATKVNGGRRGTGSLLQSFSQASAVS